MKNLKERRTVEPKVAKCNTLTQTRQFHPTAPRKGWDPQKIFTVAIL